MTIRRGGVAKYVGAASGEEGTYDAFLRPGAQVFVRYVDTDRGVAVVQDPWDAHVRLSVALTDLEEWSR